VNVEEEYHEVDDSRAGNGSSGTGRDAPVIPRQAATIGRAAV
jgi:hypothetical protein